MRICHTPSSRSASSFSSSRGMSSPLSSHPRQCVQDLVAKIQDQYLDFCDFSLVLSVMHLIDSRNLTRSTDMYDKAKKQHQQVKILLTDI